MSLRREVSVGDDIDYDMFMKALKLLYVPTINFYKESGVGGTYIKSTHDQNFYFSFHTDIGKPNKIHYNYIDHNVKKQIELEVIRDNYKAITVQRKPSETKQITRQEQEELNNIRQFFIFAERLKIDLLFNMIKDLEIELGKQKEISKICDEKLKDIDRGGYGDRSRDRNIDRIRDRSRDRSRDRYGSRYINDSNKKKYIKYKKKYLELKKKFEEKN